MAFSNRLNIYFDVETIIGEFIIYEVTVSFLTAISPHTVSYCEHLQDADRLLILSTNKLIRTVSDHPTHL